MRFSIAVVSTLLFALAPATAELPECVGDCDGDGVVRIGELIRGVKATLYFRCVIPEPELCPPLDSCFFDDVDRNGVVAIGEMSRGVGRVVRAVRNSLEGCDYEERRAADRERLNATAAEILALVEGPQSCSETADCRYVGFGDKPCGGPWRYLSYSRIAVDEIELLSRVADYNRLDEEWHLRYRVLSTCDRVRPPILSCEEELCVDVR